MKKLLLAAVLLFGLSTAPASAVTLPCGLSTQGPLWVEFGDRSVDFRFQLFGKPGVVVATNGISAPTELRALGAQTVYWVMHVWDYTGSPKAPADPATIATAADTLVQNAIASSGCDTPVIGLNELAGWYQPSPWAPNTALYRANMLSLVQDLTARGAVPFLLVPGTPAPFLDGDARGWWLQVAQAAHIVREMHFDAPHTFQMGPIVGARTRRMRMREGLGAFIRIGIPADRLGLQLGFQSGPGAAGGRGDLPRAAWLNIVKQETLSAQEVAGELDISSVWIWGWGSFGPPTTDPDKPAVACVHLWALNPALCDGPAVAGPGFNASLTRGQIVLPPGVQCSTPIGNLTVADVASIELALSGSERRALTVLLSRLIYAKSGASPSGAEVTSAKAAVIARSFGGDEHAFDSALDGFGLSQSTGRDLVADQLARQRFTALTRIGGSGSNSAAAIKTRQREELRKTVCLRDELPLVEDFDWAGQLPSLRVPAASVSIRAQRTRSSSSRITLSGHISNALSPQPVTIYARGAKAHTGFVAVGAAHASADGTWSFTVAPRASTYYRALSRFAVSTPIVVRGSRR